MAQKTSHRPGAQRRHRSPTPHLIDTPPSQTAPIERLTLETLGVGVDELCAVDADLARVVHAIGPPPLWARRPGFATLVRIILEQQVSLASGAATYKRLRGALGPITAGSLVNLSLAELRSQGVTRQKAGYIIGLAHLIRHGDLNLRRLRDADDRAARQVLVTVKGIGRWTADIYLLMALGRPDVWPEGDLALRSAARKVKRLRKLPTDTRLERMAARWRPWRSIAARILWHHYLSERKSRI